MISVIVPAFNEEKRISLCLNSIKSQDYEGEIELIVVDNNSTDKTGEIAKSFGAKVVLEKNQGNVFAMSRGFMEAKGEIAAFTDADTAPNKNWLSVIEKAFQDQNVVGITGSNAVNLKNPSDSILAIFYNFFLFATFFIGLPNLTGFNYAVRRSALEKLGGINTKYTMSSDVEVGVRLKTAGKVKFVPKMKVRANYRRFHTSFFSALKDYSKGYIFTIILRRPPPVVQKIVRE